MSTVVEDNGLRAIRARCVACGCPQIWAHLPGRDDISAWRQGCFACGRGLEVVEARTTRRRGVEEPLRRVLVSNVSVPEPIRTGT